MKNERRGILIITEGVEEERRGEESKYVVICLCFRCILYYNYYSLQFFIPINTTTIITIMIMVTL